MRRNAAKVISADRPLTWLGANFWSRTGGPLMWRNYDPATVRAELTVLRDHGLSMTRSFFYWPDFMPAPDRIDEEMTARFADFLDAHTGLGLTTVPTFIVGHMSGDNWDPAWRGGRDLYADVWMVGRQAWFAGEMVRRFGGHAAVAGWLVSNEMPLYGGRETPHETVTAWAQLIRDAVRAAGGHQPFSLGDGAWGIEVSGVENGFRLADSARLCDFLGPHVYPLGDDRIRQAYAAAWECELAGTFGKPVVLEEFGVSSDFAAEQNAARYYRHVLHNSLLAGATGWIAWNNTDFALPHQEPYLHKAFEQNFGLTRCDGSPKATLLEMSRFAATLAAIDAARCGRADTGTALIVPAYLDTAFPFSAPGDRARAAKALAQAYVSARLADLPPALVRESERSLAGESSGISGGTAQRDGLGAQATLYLAPSVKQMLAPTVLALEELAVAGACVYVSYCAGENDWHRGPSYGRLNELFGVIHQLDAGMGDPIQDEVAEFILTRDFGGLTRGHTLRLTVAGNEHSRAFLPVVPREAEVVATDAHGRPALLVRRTGAGSVVLCTYPVEQMAASTPRVNPSDTVVLYGALAAHAGVHQPIAVDDTRVACDTLVRDDGARFAVLVSHAAEPVTVKPRLPAGDRLATMAGEDVTDGVTIDGFGISLLTFTRE